MANYTRDDILDMIEEEDIEFIRLQFTDIAGNLKNMATTVDQIDKILDGRCQFDCAAVDGFDGDMEELFLIPDLDTFVIFPWRPQHGKVARFICDIVKPDGTPFDGDSRYILKRTIAQAKEMGFDFDVALRMNFSCLTLAKTESRPIIPARRAAILMLGLRTAVRMQDVTWSYILQIWGFQPSPPIIPTRRHSMCLTCHTPMRLRWQTTL